MVNSSAAAAELGAVDYEIVVVCDSEVRGCKEVGDVGGGGGGCEGVVGRG